MVNAEKKKVTGAEKKYFDAIPLRTKSMATSTPNTKPLTPNPHACNLFCAGSSQEAKPADMKQFCFDNAFLLLLLLALGFLAASFHTYQKNHPAPLRVNTCAPKAPAHMLWDALPGNILATRG